MVAHLGHGACRDVRCDQFGARPLHALRREDACRARRVGRGGRGRGGAANPGPALSQPEGDGRGGIRGIDQGHPGGPAKSKGVALGEQVAAAVLADRAADGTNVPDTYRPVTSPGVWVPTTPPIVRAICAGETMGAQERRPVPARPAAATDQRALCPRLQRDQESGRRQEHRANAEQTEAVKFWTRQLGPAWQTAARQLSAAKGLARRECAPVRAAQHGHRQHLHHRLGCEIHLQFLAAGHRDPQRRHGRQRRHRARCRLDPVERHADASGISVAGSHHRRRGDRRAGGGVRTQAGHPVHGGRYRGPEAEAAVQQHRGDGRGAPERARLGRHPLPKFARRRL